MQTIIPEHVRAILFDHDDTLVGTIEAKAAQFKHVAKEWYDKELLDKEIRTHWGKPLTTLLNVLYETEDIGLAMKRTLAVHHDFPKKLFDDTLGVIENLRANGMFIGVITSTTRYSFEYDLKSLGIPSGFFDFIQTEDDVDFHKPDPRAFDPSKKWLAFHGIEPSGAIYVGDGLNDMQAALGAGFQFIGVTTGIVTTKEFTKAGVTTTINGLSELTTNK